MRAVFGVFIVLILAGCAGEEAAAIEYFRGPTYDAVLLAEPLPDLVVEISYVEGREPPARAIRDMEMALHNLTAKRSIRIDGPVLIQGYTPNPSRRWGEADVVAMSARASRQAPVGDATGVDGVAYLHALYLEGRYDEPLRGFQRGPLLVIFPDLLARDPLEAAGLPPMDISHARVLLHELGHAMGLVDCGVPMQQPHVHPESRCHSDNDRSVMWPAVDELRVTATRVSDQYAVSTHFDSDDIADITAYVKARSRS